jgi:hypothetical protein
MKMLFTVPKQVPQPQHRPQTREIKPQYKEIIATPFSNIFSRLETSGSCNCGK